MYIICKCQADNSHWMYASFFHEIKYSCKSMQLENCCSPKHPLTPGNFPLFYFKSFTFITRISLSLINFYPNYSMAHGYLVHQRRIHCLNKVGNSAINNGFSATSPLLKYLLQLIFLHALHTHNFVSQICALYLGRLLSETMSKLWSTQFLSELDTLQSSPNINL
jgi:hypothetical protein